MGTRKNRLRELMHCGLKHNFALTTFVRTPFTNNLSTTSHLREKIFFIVSVLLISDIMTYSVEPYIRRHRTSVSYLGLHILSDSMFGTLGKVFELMHVSTKC